MKRLLSPTAVLLPVLLLAACSGTAPKSAPAVTPQTVNAAPVAPAPPPKPKITASQLLGQSGPWVAAQLGEPAFVRSERTANIWQYKNARCVLNLFLYVETEDAPRVLHFDARNAEGGNVDRETCLATVQQ